MPSISMQRIWYLSGLHLAFLPMLAAPAWAQEMPQREPQDHPLAARGAQRPVMSRDLEPLTTVPYERSARALSSVEAALLKAAKAGDAAEVKKLIEAGARVNGRDQSGRVAMVFAAGSG